jgi:hypothetical protein
LAVLLFRQLSEDVTDFVIAAALHRLFASEHLLDPSPQRFGPVDDEQVLAVGRQSLIPKVGQQALHRGGVLCRSRLNPQNVLLPLTIDAYGADDVMFGETLAID